MSQTTPSVLFVCTGNICRSPTAQALLLRKAAAQGIEVDTDSAAVTDEEVGDPPTVVPCRSCSDAACPCRRTGPG